MMDFPEMLILLVGLLGVGFVLATLPRPMKTGVLVASLLVLMLGLAAQPALANVKDDVLSNAQKALDENLKTTPEQHQYQGIEYSEEYPQEGGRSLSDREIMQRIQNEVPDDIKLSVSNGAVRLSGKVKNREVAQKIVDDVKGIEGVHEVSYDLGLAS